MYKRGAAKSHRDTGGPVKDGGAENDAVDSEGDEAAGADPVHKPGDRGVSNNERNDEADGENYPAVRVNLS